MSFRLIFVALAIILFSCKNETKETVSVETVVSADELEEKALIMYNDYPKKALNSFINVAAAYRRENNPPKEAIALLNTANIYDEHFGDYKNALQYAEQSLTIWNEEKDEMQMANLRKYTGYLHGMVGNFDQAKADIKEAKRLYNKMAYDQGMAVAEYNLSRVLFQEGNYKDSAVEFDKSVKFWEEKENAGRLFSMYTFGIDLFNKLEDVNRVEQFKEANYKMMTTIRLPELELDKFKKVVGLVENKN